MHGGDDEKGSKFGAYGISENKKGGPGRKLRGKLFGETGNRKEMCFCVIARPIARRSQSCCYFTLSIDRSSNFSRV